MEDELRGRACLPDRATCAVQPLHDRISDRPRPVPRNGTPGLSFLGDVPSMRAFVQRRELLLGLAALPVAARIAVAETYPSRAVRILVATSAGGGTDLVARFIAQWLTERLGHSFFVQDRPSGGNNIGTERAARSPPDGHTPFTRNTVNTTKNPRL